MWVAIAGRPATRNRRRCSHPQCVRLRRRGQGSRAGSQAPGEPRVGEPTGRRHGPPRDRTRGVRLHRDLGPFKKARRSSPRVRPRRGPGAHGCPTTRALQRGPPHPCRCPPRSGWARRPREVGRGPRRLRRRALLGGRASGGRRHHNGRNRGLVCRGAPGEGSGIGRGPQCMSPTTKVLGRQPAEDGRGRSRPRATRLLWPSTNCLGISEWPRRRIRGTLGAAASGNGTNGSGEGVSGESRHRRQW